MSQNGVDPKDDPDYLSLSEVGKECGVGVAVLKELVRARTLVDGVVRTKLGHLYVHRDHVPSWSEVESTLAQMYQQQLGRVEKAMGAFEAEVEAVRFDLNEAQADPNAALGEDLRSVGVHAYSSSGKTLSGALSTLSLEVLALSAVRGHLDDVRRPK